jgi:acyl phosphate:glycerol-3-phosphate acyltransferase
MFYTLIIIEVVIAYLLGSIPTATLVGKLFYRIDIREHGSGNAGATNTIRVLGYKAGIPVLLFDVFKGWFAVQLVFIFDNELMTQNTMTYVSIALALAVVLGHIFPIFAGFRGGKGVGTLAGVGIALYPLAILIILGIFIVTLATTRYVSLSSVLCALAFPFIVIFITKQHNPGLMALSVLVGVFIPITHRNNIKRLIKGTENKFDFKRKNAKMH